MSNGRLLGVGVELKPHHGPHASPVCAAVQSGTGLEVHTWGGFTKYESAALQMAAGLAAGGVADGEIPSRAASVAEGVLVECEKILKQRIEEAKNADQG